MHICAPAPGMRGLRAMALILLMMPHNVAFWSERVLVGLQPPICPRMVCCMPPPKPCLTRLRMRLNSELELEESESLDTSMPRYKRFRRPSNWWQDARQVKEELVSFCEANNLPIDILPSEREFRSHPGGMHIIHAIRKHGGFGKFSQLVDIPARRQRESPARPKKTNVTAVKEDYGRFSEEITFHEHLLNYSKTIDNWNWKVLPSNADLKESGRTDIINAIYRYGGRKHIAKKFGFLLASEYNYLVEFYFLLKELRAYQQEKGQLGKMPPFKQLTADGRRDLMRMICKHGGQNVLAARLDLQMDVRRKPYLYWGPFSIDFAIDLIEIAGRHCEEVGQGERILMPNATTLQAINRTDMIEKIEYYGGFVDVARRVGMDAE